MGITVQTDSSYPNRVQVILGDIIGPLSSAVRPFDPGQDLAIYVDGTPQAVVSYSFDAVNNCYDIFTQKTFNSQGVVQVVYHMPIHPFKDTMATLVSGFYTIGTYVVD